MPNIFWYIVLTVIGLVTAAYVIYKKRGTYKISTLLVYYLLTACLTWIGEFIVLGLFDAYAYKTGVFTDPWAQNLFGHLLINTTLYPAAAIVMVTYSLRFGWIFSVATVFTIIEYFFVKYHLYEQHWWRYYMTVLAGIFFLSLYHKWFSKLKHKPYGTTRAVTFYFVAMLIMHLPAPILLLWGKQYYQLSFVNDLVGNLYLSSIIIVFFYHLIEAMLFVLFTCNHKKWYWSLIPIAISITAQSIFAMMGILVIHESWSLVYTLIIYQVFNVIYILLEKYTIQSSRYQSL